MTEDQKAILNSFPKTDRGLFGDDLDNEETKAEENENGTIEWDPIEAAAKKAKLKQKAMRARRQEREQEDEELGKKRVRFVNDEEEVLDDDDDFEDVSGEDSNEIVYDSEEEDAAEREHQERVDKKKEIEETNVKNTEEIKGKETLYDIA